MIEIICWLPVVMIIGLAACLMFTAITQVLCGAVGRLARAVVYTHAWACLLLYKESDH